MFKHFLITRFNLRASDWKTSKNNIAVLTKEWHKNRFELFTDFCFPSVASQTNKNFEWLVYFDVTTPDVYKKTIYSLKDEMENFKPIFIDGMDSFLPSIEEYISNFNEPYLITSRIDNDDCISKFYINEVQKQFNSQSYMALDFINGYTLQTYPNIKIGNRLDQFNPFISLIEVNNQPKTVWHKRHSHWKREKNITQIKDLKIWSSIIHQENKVNEFFGFGKVDLDDFFSDFKISDNQINIIRNNLIPINKWKFKSLSNICSSYWNLYFKNFKKWLGIYKYK